MPRVRIRTGFYLPDGQEEVLSEFMCDEPGCGNIATEVVGHLNESGLSAVACREHAAIAVRVRDKKRLRG